MKGLVIKSTGSWYQIRDIQTLRVYEARIRGKFKLLKNRLTNPLAVGDFISYQLEAGGVAWITKIEPRKNYLIRKSVNLSKESQIIASNVDIACILFTLKQPQTSLGFLDRFLVCCEAYNIEALIVFNKTDLLDDVGEMKSLERIYGGIGYPSVEISALKGDHRDLLVEKIKDKTSVFFGHSGSGKSTTINMLDPKADLKTGEISDVHLKGKHTTTFAQMHFWPFGGQVIDTPGVKELAMIDMKKEEIEHFFPEIFEAGQCCRYGNCTHTIEPKCAVKEALEKGEIMESRYVTYLKLFEEAEQLTKK